MANFLRRDLPGKKLSLIMLNLSAYPVLLSRVFWKIVLCASLDMLDSIHGLAVLLLPYAPHNTLWALLLIDSEIVNCQLKIAACNIMP